MNLPFYDGLKLVFALKRKEGEAEIEKMAWDYYLVTLPWVPAKNQVTFQEFMQKIKNNAKAKESLKKGAKEILNKARGIKEKYLARKGGEGDS